jgi:ATP-dependent Clp protease adaptor protein ClpS
MSSQSTPDIIEQTEVETELAQVWKVIVLNDPVNLMNYVVMVFRKVFGYGEQKAIKHMKEVHELGKSILWSGEREQAESYVFQLQKWRLQAVLEKDD